MRIRSPIFAIILLIFANGAMAHRTPPNCESLLGPLRPVTLRTLKESSRERIQRNQLLAAAPGFDNIEVESRVEQIGEQGPQALQQILGLDKSFVATPAPTSPDVTTVSLLEEMRSFPVHVDTQWAGRRSSTTVYASLPQPVNAGGFLIGPEYPVVLVHLHGGGTPTATGKNGVSIGEKMVAHGIPVLAPDMPGHGRATRNPEGLMSFEEQSAWLINLLEQLVHPAVKIVLSGHSWGGMFAIYMHRHSDELRFSRISRFISLSPGVDASMGGSASDRVRADQWYEKNYPLFESRIAAADFEFQENLLSNGKDSDIGAFFTGFTNMDYSTPPLTPEDQAKLKPLTVVVGTADGVVYVGREKPFDAIFGALAPPSSYVKLGPGRSWKSRDEADLQPTGHNIFDRYIDGTTNLEVYTLIANVLRAEASSFSPDSGDRAAKLVDEVFRHYANFFAFREMVAHHVEYLVTPTDYLAEVSARKVELDDYNRKVGEARASAKREADAAVNAAISALRERLGITDGLTPERAGAELNLPELTDVRRSEIEAFVRGVEAIDADMKATFTDALAENEEKALAKEFASTLEKAGVRELSEYRSVLDALMAEKTKDKDSEKLRSALGRLHQKYLQIQKGKQNRYGLERDRRMAAMGSPPGITDLRSALRELRADRSVERRAALQKFLDEAPAVEKMARQKASAAIEARIEAIPKPVGVNSVAHARELGSEMDSRLSFTFVPPKAPEIRPLTLRLLELQEEQEKVNQGQEGEVSLERLEASVRELRRKKAGLLKRWDGLWQKGEIGSPALTQLDQTQAKTLESFKEIYYSYEHAKSRWLTELKEHGKWSPAIVLQQTPELLTLRRRTQHAKRVFLAARKARDDRRWTEALAGQLVGPEGFVNEAKRLAQEYRSAEEVLKSQEDYFEVRRQKLSLINREIEERRVEYVEAMKEVGEPVPYGIERIAIWNLLNQPLADLLHDLRTRRGSAEALTRTISRWEAMLSELRSEL